MGIVRNSDDKVFYVASTDVLRLVRFGTRLHNPSGPYTFDRKWEEGVFSDLRVLKDERGAKMFDRNHAFLEVMIGLMRVRTVKKQKLFISQDLAPMVVPHETT